MFMGFWDGSWGFGEFTTEAPFRVVQGRLRHGGKSGGSHRGASVRGFAPFRKGREGRGAARSRGAAPNEGQ
jgi:hypothetical protein